MVYLGIMSLDEEFLEIFGSVENYESATKTFEKISLVEEECSHSHLEIFPDESGYCRDCGISFTNKNTFLSTSSKGCSHTDVYEDSNGLFVCRDCNQETEKFDFEPEWKYYNINGVGGGKNPERCHRTKTTGRGIENVFKTHKITAAPAIIAQVENKYTEVVGSDTLRGKGRQAVIAACLFHTYKEFGEYRTSDYVRNLFKLTRKQMSTGLTRYYEKFPDARTLNTSAENLLRWILTLTGVSQSHYRKIVQISRYLENSSRLLKRSSPQSVASAIVYFYLCLNPEYKSQLGLTKNKFAEKALLSDITVTKLVREAAEVSRCNIPI